MFTHASWSDRRSDSYERLAFLGDSVLSLAVTSHLYPRLEAESSGAGRLTKIRAQAVSGRACKEVAEALGLPARLKDAAPASATGAGALVRTERALASVIEAVIGACYLTHGFTTTAAAVVLAFEAQIEAALEHPEDAKSTLQERLARSAEVVAYEVVSQSGPPHDRTFEVAAIVGDRELGRGTGRSKKDAEQIAAQAALDDLSQ